MLGLGLSLRHLSLSFGLGLGLQNSWYWEGQSWSQTSRSRPKHCFLTLLIQHFITLEVHKRVHYFPSKVHVCEAHMKPINSLQHHKTITKCCGTICAIQTRNYKEPLLFRSSLGSFTCIAQHTEPTALRPIQRMQQKGHKCHDRDPNPHSADRKHQSSSTVFHSSMNAHWCQGKKQLYLKISLPQ